MIMTSKRPEYRRKVRLIKKMTRRDPASRAEYLAKARAIYETEKAK